MKKLVLGLVLLSSPAFAWDETNGCGYRWSAACVYGDDLQTYVSPLFPTRDACKGTLYTRIHRADGSVKPNVHVLTPCEIARCPGQDGFKLKAEIGDDDESYGTLDMRYFTATETCDEARNNLLAIPDLDVDIIRNCTPLVLP